MLKGDPAIVECGFVIAHAKVFSSVANTLEVVIVSRALNPLCTGLLEESYAAKGFHIKAKTCNFGPMAGFVCVEPNFSKKGPDGAKDQQKENEASVNKHHCGAEHLRISTDRLKALVMQKVVQKLPGGSSTLVHLEAQKNVPNALKGIKFVAKEAGKNLWALYVDPKSTKAIQTWAIVKDGKIVEVTEASGDDPGIPIYGLTNPTNVTEFGAQPKDHKAAVAGDYDLFCVCPRLGSEQAKWTKRPMQLEHMPLKLQLDAKNFRASVYEPLIADLCDLPTKAKEKLGKALGVDKVDPETLRNKVLELSKANKLKDFHSAARGVLASAKEDPHQGNITALAKMVKAKLNAGIRSTGYQGGYVVMHSDDAGNPFSAEPDYPLMAFVPGDEPWALQNASELEAFYTSLLLTTNKTFNKAGHLYDVTLNPNWF